MNIDVLTLFPEMVEAVFSSSIIGKAREKELVNIQTVNFREYANNKHHTVDDYPYGGGGGMVLKPEPLFDAVEDLQSKIEEPDRSRVILMCPQGERFTQQTAERLAAEQHLIFICGHYEGYDERIRQHLATDELSIGDYVLTGGELPAMVVIDSIVRLLPGVLGNAISAETDSFSTGLLEYPQYTRPAVYRNWPVPEVLVSGHHGRIEEWRRKQSLLRTWQRRPELLESLELTPEEERWLNQIRAGEFE